MDRQTWMLKYLFRQGFDPSFLTALFLNSERWFRIWIKSSHKGQDQFFIHIFIKKFHSHQYSGVHLKYLNLVYILQNFPSRTFIPDRTFFVFSQISLPYVYSRPYVYISPQSIHVHKFSNKNSLFQLTGHHKNIKVGLE